MRTSNGPGRDTVATILRLRRAAESAARRELLGALGALEALRAAESAARAGLIEAQAAVAGLSRGAARPGPVQAGALQRHQAALQQGHERVRDLRARHGIAVQRRIELERELERLRGALRQAMSRREAAELHEAQELRRRQLRRARQVALQEDEAVERRATARLAQGQRAPFTAGVTTEVLNRTMDRIIE